MSRKLKKRMRKPPFVHTYVEVWGHRHALPGLILKSSGLGRMVRKGTGQRRMESGMLTDLEQATGPLWAPVSSSAREGRVILRSLPQLEAMILYLDTRKLCNSLCNVLILLQTSCKSWCVAVHFSVLLPHVLTSGALMTLERLPITRYNKGLTCQSAYHMQTKQATAHSPTTSFISPHRPSAATSHLPKPPQGQVGTTRDSPFAPSPPVIAQACQSSPCLPCLGHSSPRKLQWRLLPMFPFTPFTS